MIEYRAYIVGADGHFESFKIVEAESDERAVEIARQNVNGHGIEVWHLARKVAVLASDDVK